MRPEPAIAALLREMLQHEGHAHTHISQGWIDEAAQPLHPQEAAVVAGSVARRQAEFAAGRRHAHKALRAAGLPDTALLPDAQRVPLWPAGCVGAISHDAQWCAAAVAPSDAWAGLGLDIELVERLDLKLEGSIATAAERARLPIDAEARRAALAQLFSIKEACFKAHFPHTRAWLGFDEAEVTLPAAGSQRFSLQLLKPAGPYAIGHRFEGRCAVAQERVGALVLMRH